MESIAEAVSMSKVTVYGYFSDKDAVFLAVAKALAAELEAAVNVALGEAGPDTRRIANALVAKHELVARIVRGSSHAQELFAAKDRTAASLFDELDRRIVASIETALVARGPAYAARTAPLVFACAQGIANHAPDMEETERGIRRMVEALLR